eukprot:3579410-Rhodomonas_salina.2
MQSRLISANMLLLQQPASYDRKQRCLVAGADGAARAFAGGRVERGGDVVRAAVRVPAVRADGDGGGGRGDRDGAADQRRVPGLPVAVLGPHLQGRAAPDLAHAADRAAEAHLDRGGARARVAEAAAQRRPALDADAADADAP